MRSLWCVVVILALLGAFAANAEVTATVRKPTHIAAQELGPALQMLARERDFQIVYASEVIGHARTEGASGDLTAEEAVEQLLRGTGLSFRHIGDSTAITIVPGIVSADDSLRGNSEVRSAQRSARGADEVAYTAPASDSAALSQVTVEARREALKQRLNTFISNVTRANAGSQQDPLAVWDSPLCFAIAGLPRPQGEYVLDRLSKAAEAAGAVGARQRQPAVGVPVVGGDRVGGRVVVHDEDGRAGRRAGPVGRARRRCRGRPGGGGRGSDRYRDSSDRERRRKGGRETTECLQRGSPSLGIDLTGTQLLRPFSPSRRPSVTRDYSRARCVVS